MQYFPSWSVRAKTWDDKFVWCHKALLELATGLRRQDGRDVAVDL